MQGAAVLVLLSLIAPPLAHVACELGCAETPPNAVTSSTVSCHDGKRDAEHAPSLSAGQLLCHDADGPATATVPDAQKAGPAPIACPAVASAVESSPPRHARIVGKVPPPPRLSLATQLRI